MEEYQKVLVESEQKSELVEFVEEQHRAAEDEKTELEMNLRVVDQVSMLKQTV